MEPTNHISIEPTNHISIEPTNEYTSVYIYKKMSPECGYAILNGYLKINPLHLEETKPVVWLIRESNYDGMLTIDYAFFREYSWWDTTSYRFLLTPKGWINATNINNPEVQNAMNSMITIDSKIAKDHLPQWENFIANSFHLDKKYRINPSIDEQTTNGIYSDYGDVLKNKVILNPGITQAISCELSRKPFKEPVIMKNDLQIGNFKLYKGRSYEKSALIKLKFVPEEAYCPNLTLKEVVNRLGSLIKEKIEALSEDKLTDSILFDLMKSPLVLPSGKSIDETTWHQIQESTNICPHTRAPLGEILPNYNLRAFIEEWELYKETFIEELEQNL